MRERPRDKARLKHILEACDIITDAVKKFGFEAIQAEPIMLHGLVKQIEIIGEAVYMLSKEFKEQNPVAPWQQIEDMRHILVHDYYRINYSKLRVVVEKDLAELIPKIQDLYDKE